TISSNSALTAGGGIFIFTPALSSSSLTVENSTISGNSTGVDGGGIEIDGGTAMIRNSTVAFNTADSRNNSDGQGGGLFVDVGASVTVVSPSGADTALGASGSAPDISGPVAATFSLVENTAGTTFLPGPANNLTGVDPLLGPLADNGGPTQTHALLPGSPA